MVQDLVVEQGTQLTLDENPGQVYSEAFQRIKINKLEDLVEAGVVRSREVLGQLLSAAQTATETALHSRETYTPQVLIPGTRLPDLRRFGTFRAATPEVSLAQAEPFWRVVRSIEPTALIGINNDTLLQIRENRFSEILKFLLGEVEVNANAVLTLAPKISMFQCSKLTIRSGGKIVVQGSGLTIRATSIQGNL